MFVPYNHLQGLIRLSCKNCESAFLCGSTLFISHSALHYFSLGGLRHASLSTSSSYTLLPKFNNNLLSFLLIYFIWYTILLYAFFLWRCSVMPVRWRREKKPRGNETQEGFKLCCTPEISFSGCIWWSIDAPLLNPFHLILCSSSTRHLYFLFIHINVLFIICISSSSDSKI